MMWRQWGLSLSTLFISCCFAGCDSGTPDKAKAEKPKPLAPGPVDPDAPEEFTTTESGLKYRIRRKSDGTKPGPDKYVIVKYRGWLDDSTIVQTTYGSGGAPANLDLARQPPGWREGVMLIGEGGMIEFEVPPNLAFGERGDPPSIPPNATMHYLVELVSIQDPPKLPEPPSIESEGGLTPGPVDKDAPEEFTTTESGLKYRIRRKSDGPMPTATSKVRVHYRGWLDSGRVFDSSYARNEPATMGLDRVIAGWTEGMQLVGVGGMIELEVPGNLGYGPSGSPPKIPPDATLHFIIELLDMKK